MALLRSRDLLRLGELASERRAQKVPGDRATYIIDRNINYTNVCVSGCRFCAFHCKPGDEAAYVLTQGEIHQKIEETVALGGTAILMQGGLHPICPSVVRGPVPLDQGAVRRSPSIRCPPPEIVHIAKVSGLKPLPRRSPSQAAGLDSLPGGGAEILVDRVREQSPRARPRRATWLGVMREAHRRSGCRARPP